ncbi:MAG: lysophospholipid acyltransferase family protein [Chthoniobacterales bacterium]
MKKQRASMGFVYYFFYTLARWIATALFDYRVFGRKNIPEEGGLVIAVNHSSFFDPPLAGICCRRAVHYLARKTLLKWPFFGPLFPDMNVIPVDRGGADMSALKEVIRKIKSGEGVVLFPEGTRSIDGNLQKGQPGIGMVIAKTRAPVLPIRIFGAHAALPKSGDSFKMVPIRAVIGKPFTFSEDELSDKSREAYQHLSDVVMKNIAALSLPADDQDSQKI